MAFEPTLLPDHLCELTGLTQLCVRGPPFYVQTRFEYKEEAWNRGLIEGKYDEYEGPDSEGLESDAFHDDPLHWTTLSVSSEFHLPQLRQLSLLNCRLEAVPDFVAGARAAVA